MNRGLTNIAAQGVDHLADLVKHQLRACQQQTGLLAGFFTNTGMPSIWSPCDDANLSLSTSV